MSITAPMLCHSCSFRHIVQGEHTTLLSHYLVFAACDVNDRSSCLVVVSVTGCGVSLSELRWTLTSHHSHSFRDRYAKPSQSHVCSLHRHRIFLLESSSPKCFARSRLDKYLLQKTVRRELSRMRLIEVTDLLSSVTGCEVDRSDGWWVFCAAGMGTGSRRLMAERIAAVSCGGGSCCGDDGSGCCCRCCGGGKWWR